MSKILNEKEAADRAGVSIETIRQYNKLGLLMEAKELAGGYYQLAIDELFFVKSKVEEATTPESANGQASQSFAETSTSSPAQSQAKASPVAETVTSTTKNDNTSTESVTTDTFTQETIVTAQPTVRQDSYVPLASQIETISVDSKLMMELNNELRSQIAILRDERDWLKRRVEALEVRGERDQLLLLHKSETLRQITSERPKAKFSLGWLGLGSGNKSGE